MSIDQQFPRDPAVAAEMLAALAEKDRDESRCRYPVCSEPRQAATGSGRPSAYCRNPEHNPVSNHRARQHLKNLAAGAVTEETSKREQPGPDRKVSLESLRGSVVNGILQLQANLERYLAALAELADPDLMAAQIQAIVDQAETRVADVQQRLSQERSLRLEAEGVRQAALEEAQSAREAAEEAIGRMEEAEAGMRLLQEQTARQIADVQAERDATVEQVRTETQNHIQQVLHETREAVSVASEEAARALEQATQADLRATAAETEARAQVTAAERLISEANANLARERDEVGRLLKELAGVRQQAEIERAEGRAEIERLRGELVSARQQAEVERAENSAALERERNEVDRLRSELGEARRHTEQAMQRAEKLAALTDELRAQLVQAQARPPQHPA